MSMYVRWADRVLALDALYDPVLWSYDEQLLKILLCGLRVYTLVAVLIEFFLSRWLQWVLNV